MDLELRSKFLLGKTSRTSAITDKVEKDKPTEGVFYYNKVMYVVIIDRIDLYDAFLHREDIIYIHDISSEKIAKSDNISELYINIVNNGEYYPVVNAYQNVSKYMDDIPGLHAFLYSKFEAMLISRVVKQCDLKSSFDLFACRDNQYKDIYITKVCNENFTIKVTRSTIDKHGCIDKNANKFQYHIDILYLMLCVNPNMGKMNIKHLTSTGEFDYTISSANPVSIGNEIFTKSCGIFFKTRRIWCQIHNEAEFSIPYTIDECINFLQSTGQHQSAEYIKIHSTIADSALSEFIRRY